MEHRGARIHQFEYSNLSPSEVVTAADQVRRIVAAEPLRSARILTVIHSKLTAEGAETLKWCARTSR